MNVYKGTTYIELIVVLTIMSLIVVASYPFITRFTSDNNLNISTEIIINTLRKAQNNSITNKDNNEWGICYVNKTILVFSGTCASPITSDVYNIPENISIEGLENTKFSVGRGEPSQELDINITSHASSRRIMVNSVGGISSE